MMSPAVSSGAARADSSFARAGVAVESAAATKTTKKTAAKTTAAKRRVTRESVRQARARRDRVRRERSAVASRLRSATATNRDAERALRALTGDVRTQQRALASARRSLSRAEAELSAAQTAEKAIEERIGVLRLEQRSLSVGAYASGGLEDGLLAFAAPSLAEAGRRTTMSDLASQRSADLLDELRSLEEDLERERTAAQRAQTRRENETERMTGRLEALSTARGRQESVADQAEDRLEAALAEAESLAQIDGAAASAYEREAGELARQLEAADRSGRRPRSTGASGSIPDVGDVGAVSSSGTRGISVAPSIRDNLARMLDAAERDGVILRGYGWRNNARQVELRRANCGSSSFAVYRMRASQCRPPTARPGYSQHERGLAIDFTQNGRSLSRGTSGYRWLKANAHRFGFKNLPSEPWHWSTTGR